MSHGLLFASGTMVVLIGLSLIGLLVSIYLDRHGVPEGLHGQAAKRKKGTLGKRLPLIALNLSLLAVTSFPALYLLADFFPFTRPHLGLAAAQVAFIFLVDDFFFYWFHRALHRVPKLYQKIHKVHHKAYAPVPIEYIYAHPLEWMGGSTGPTVAVGLLLLGFGELSAWTFWAWGAMRTFHELDIHSGVRALIGFRPPLYADMVHHDLHHAKPALGNYSSALTLWDKVMGTEIARPEAEAAGRPVGT